jgi:aminoglycoside phosphotransferase (APT) family kinase protein
LDAQLARFLAASGLVDDPAAAIATPLTGGVASDIWRIDVGGRRFAVKRALGRLRVAQDWRVPVERNAFEADYLRAVGAILPGAVPRLLAEGSGLFAMTFFEPATHPVWKAELAAGRADPGFAASVGRVLAAIHAATAGERSIAGRFATHANFAAIRLDPYLAAAAEKNPAMAPALLHLSRRTAATRLALVHGDVSPKNILVGPDGPILLDAECAVHGDPAFDLAFVLTHLLLKCLLVPPAAQTLLACFAALAGAYRAGIAWEAPAELEARAASLLPGLLLARIDGKSPVEYLTAAADQALVRRAAGAWLADPPPDLAAIADGWRRKLPRIASAVHTST